MGDLVSCLGVFYVVDIRVSRIAYVNGSYVPQGQAVVSIADRGFQFGDGVYGVVALCAGRPIDLEEHIARFAGYAQEIRLDLPVSHQVLRALCLELIRRNRVSEGSLYLQLTRGQAPRTHAFPDTPVTASLIMIVKDQPLIMDVQNLACVSVVTTPDSRSRRSYIKSTSLLPTVLLRQQAKEQGCFETWLLDPQGYVCEGASSNAYIVVNGTIITRPQDGSLVPGVTRSRLLSLAASAGIPIVERAFSKDEALKAQEAFLSGALSMVKSVVKIDDQILGDGTPGVITRQLAALYFDYCRSQVRAPLTPSLPLRTPRPRPILVPCARPQDAWPLAS